MKPLRHYLAISATTTTITILAALLFSIRPVHANTEKVIFKGPAPGPIPLTTPSLPDLDLFTLSPDTALSVRTELSRVFPTPGSGSAYELGVPVWLLLDNLTDGQRYELRVCWSALEPTDFTLDVFTLDTVFNTPDLIQSLAEYTSRQADASTPTLSSRQQDPKSRQNTDLSGERNASVLFLRVIAAADYFSHHEHLMKNPPPVLVDLILDPYFLNVLPESLLPTVGYVIVVAIIAWFVTQVILDQLSSVARPGEGDNVDEKKKQI